MVTDTLRAYNIVIYSNKVLILLISYYILMFVN